MVLVPAVTFCNLNAFDTSKATVKQTISQMQAKGLIRMPTASSTPYDYVSSVQQSIKIYAKVTKNEKNASPEGNLTRKFTQFKENYSKRILKIQ